MTSMKWQRTLSTAGILLLGFFLSVSASAQNLFNFYREVTKDGRIYVFADGQRFDAWEKGGPMNPLSIGRPGYGPNGEVVIFDSEEAINLYNFKHNLPGEVFPPRPVPAPKPTYPTGRFSGLMFGDYYWYDAWHGDTISASNSAKPDGQQGFWLRRAYFTYDLQFSEKFTTRFRLEVNSNGQFTNPGNITPFVKDAYLRWNFKGKQNLTLGIQPTLTFDWIEGWWGLRHIEKTPADLYRIDSSRDFGLTLSGPLNVGAGALSYGAQIANDSGNGSETDKYKTGRFEARWDKNPGLGASLNYNYGKRPSGQDRSTFDAFAGYRNKEFRAAAQYLWQERKSGNATPDQKIDIWSAFGIWEFKPKKYEVYFRFDKVKGTRGGVDTGLPGADGIDYWILSTAQPFKTYMVGGEIFLHPSIRIGPNMQLAQYDNDPDPIKFPGKDKDRIFRITFFWTF
jgi:hypothetical protein